MKRVVFGSALLISGILWVTLSAIISKGMPVGGFFETYGWLGFVLFIIGVALGIKGLSEKE